MLKLSHIIVTCSKTKSRLRTLVRFNNFSSSVPTAELKNNGHNSTESYIGNQQTSKNPVINSKANSAMVAAAFASLQSEHPLPDIKTPFTDERITKATSIDEILSISEGTGVSRRHALKVVSVLADWSTSGKVKLADFDSDPRFIKLCRILTKGAVNSKNRNSVSSRSEDLSTILSVTADDEAAKLVGSITLPQMVKVMSTLSQRKRRSTLLLRALAYNITASSDRLDLKQSSDLLYSMSTLNFPDENLLSRIGNDVCIDLESDVKKSAVIGSIITSVGLLKYKNSDLLDTLSQWVLKNHAICRPQDIFSLFMTLAVLHYTPNNCEKLFEEIIPQLTPSEASKPLVWLDIVWSLMLLNQANHEHISSVLSSNFLDRLEVNPLNVSTQLKLLNIDGAAKHLIQEYKGPRLPTSSLIRNGKISYNKDKAEMVEAVLDSLRNLIQSENLIRARINSGLGFLIDAEFSLDKKCNPVLLSQTNLNDGILRIALMAYDYHDMTRGRVEPTGINVLAHKLLEAQGYKVIIIPHTEFKPRDKLIHRVKYIENKLKEAVKC
ncbi:protein TBRG4 isoform X2 [Anoplophora glabripennis]|nr:protein TBRG4 isoform X2 [Anoplophora glabripennis]